MTEWHVDSERRAATDLAVDLNFSAHQIAVLFAQS
ncbi:hypothetical protein GP2143_08359 [marine gamma proteobacterium HTCC2143]|uniref:Uncharacterized protein n=1 Tax=marine gamma proteobacterium HTCC2143 TaxID=247633 RepID=A0YCM9_9GAMM|nr:hypothetical protein GP2143_08359 [marine gamma proteobacterium HTCC2143]